jgi:hypothetical protein
MGLCIGYNSYLTIFCDVWIQTLRAAVTARRPTNIAITIFPVRVLYEDKILTCIQSLPQRYSFLKSIF